MNVTKHTRAGKHGKVIRCPKCNGGVRVYHFAWSALGCRGCQITNDPEYMINKHDWLLT